MADVVTVQDVQNYLGIDYADDMVTANISRAIKTADNYLKGAIGANYPAGDPRVQELALMLIADMYDNRGLNETSYKYSSMVRRLAEDIILQLKCEHARSGLNDV